eukprot:CAMPEP_0118960802 /NCGR_PEP_ID=MMETSP1169-20130426/63824_1 /TAXON_ID=36882 /ORGANISM="Pyramimonas obovata, Strain CCMP722" /LENGTH=113 /DNA_ID=CAMNT_0006908955 /DNA_START=157 /DNA_END=498 /DNA_ORIENTATION=+
MEAVEARQAADPLAVRELRHADAALYAALCGVGCHGGAVLGDGESGEHMRGEPPRFVRSETPLNHHQLLVGHAVYSRREARVWHATQDGFQAHQFRPWERSQVCAVGVPLHHI